MPNFCINGVCDDVPHDVPHDDGLRDDARDARDDVLRDGYHDDVPHDANRVHDAYYIHDVHNAKMVRLQAYSGWFRDGSDARDELHIWRNTFTMLVLLLADWTHICDKFYRCYIL